MEEAKGVVKHVLLAKFKEGIKQEEIDGLIKGYANLVNLIEPMKAFQWGKDVSFENRHQGFTHIFESTFESTEGIAEYAAHPAHVEYANQLLASLEKILVVDYKPTTDAGLSVPSNILSYWKLYCPSPQALEIYTHCDNPLFGHIVQVLRVHMQMRIWVLYNTTCHGLSACHQSKRLA